MAYELGDDGRVPGSNFEDRQRDIVSSLMQVFLEAGGIRGPLGLLGPGAALLLDVSISIRISRGIMQKLYGE